MSTETPLTDLYVKIGRLERQLQASAERLGRLQHRLELTQTVAASVRAQLLRLERENAMLRAALANYTDVVESVNDPTSFAPKVRDAGGPARNAIAHRYDCIGCPLCVSFTASPAATREDLDTSIDGRMLR